jgi:molybdenum cofactor cytidylyltransferase
MGQNKLLLELNGEPIIRRSVRRAIEAGLHPVVVVLGHDPDAARHALADLDCRTVVNPHFRRGVNRSLWAGVATLSVESAAVVVLLADMPLVTAEMIAVLVDRYREDAAPLVVSEYDGVTAPPILYDRSLFPELGAAEGEGCGKRVVGRHRDQAIVVPWLREALSDLDDPRDYERVKALVASR